MKYIQAARIRRRSVLLSLTCCSAMPASPAEPPVPPFDRRFANSVPPLVRPYRFWALAQYRLLIYQSVETILEHGDGR